MRVVVVPFITVVITPLGIRDDLSAKVALDRVFSGAAEAVLSESSGQPFVVKGAFVAVPCDAEGVEAIEFVVEDVVAALAVESVGGQRVSAVTAHEHRVVDIVSAFGALFRCDVVAWPCSVVEGLDAMIVMHVQTYIAEHVVHCCRHVCRTRVRLIPCRLSMFFSVLTAALSAFVCSYLLFVFGFGRAH